MFRLLQTTLVHLQTFRNVSESYWCIFLLNEYRKTAEWLMVLAEKVLTLLGIKKFHSFFSWAATMVYSTTWLQIEDLSRVLHCKAYMLHWLLFDHFSYKDRQFYRHISTLVSNLITFETAHKFERNLNVMSKLIPPTTPLWFIIPYH
jgi:hypothetical protein